MSLFQYFVVNKTPHATIKLAYGEGVMVNYIKWMGKQ